MYSILQATGFLDVMAERIAGRCHVGDRAATAQRYALSRIHRETIRKVRARTDAKVRAELAYLLRAVKREHLANRALARDLHGGV
jgi:hypothetical protein